MSPETEVVDLKGAREALLELVALVQELHGLRLPPPAQRKDRVAALAPVQRKLNYAAHLCDVARVEIMDAYHATRGMTPPPEIGD